AARSRLQSNQTMRQKYQELIDKINRGEFAGTFEDAQNEIVRGVNGTVLAETVWDERLGRPKLTIHPPPPGTTGCTAIGLPETLMHEFRHYYKIMEDPLFREMDATATGRNIIPYLQHEIDDYTALI